MKNANSFDNTGKKKNMFANKNIVYGRLKISTLREREIRFQQQENGISLAG